SGLSSHSRTPTRTEVPTRRAKRGSPTSIRPRPRCPPPPPARGPSRGPSTRTAARRTPRSGGARPGYSPTRIPSPAARPPHTARALERSSMRRALGWLGLVIALAAGTAVRWTPPGDVEDLRPRPDALEYEEGARNLAAGEGYCLIMDGGCYPPRYPPGFSML